MTDVISRIAKFNHWDYRFIGGDQFDGQWVNSVKTFLSNVSLAASGSQTIDLSTYLPDTTHRWEVIFEVRGNTGTTSGNTIRLLLGSGTSGNGYYREWACRTRTSSSEYTGGSASIVINAGEAKVIIQNTESSAASGVYVIASHYRCLGWNEHSTAPQNQIENIKIPTTTLSPNGIMWGNLVNTNGVLSNFDRYSYFEVINGKQNNNAEYVVKFTINGQSTNYQSIMNASFFTAIDIIPNSYNIATYNWQTSSYVTLFTATNNTTYWVKFTINGTSVTYNYSTDGTNYTQVASYSDNTLTTADNNFNLSFGNHSNIGSRNTRPFLGTIDLSECYINVNGEHYWSGLDYTETVPFGGDNFDGQWFSYNNTELVLLSSTTLNATTSTSVDISSYIPNDGYSYELLIRGYCRTSTTAGNNVFIRVGANNSISSDNPLLMRGLTRTASYRNISGNCLLPISATQRKIYIYNAGNATATTMTIQITGIKRVGKNVTGNSGYISNIKTSDGITVPFGGKITDGQWANKRTTVVSAVQFNDSAATNHDYTVSNYLPTNNEWYEILASTYGATGSTSGNQVNWAIYCNPQPLGGVSQQGMYINTRSSSTQIGRINQLLIGRQDNNGNLVVRIRNYGTVQTGNNNVYFSGYRRLGTNV